MYVHFRLTTKHTLVSIDTLYYNALYMEENNAPQAIAPIHTPPQAPKESKWKAAWEFIRFIIMVVALVVVVRVFIAQPFVVEGTSMVPSYQNSDYLIIDQLTYHFREPHRGDVIVFHPPVDPKTYYIKRVIGVPGDTVIIKDGKVTLKNDEHPNGILLPEEYITPDNRNDNFTLEVTEGNYFVMGDNRPASFDSRRWGLLPEKNISGRVLLRLFPLSNFGFFPTEGPLY